MKRTLSVFYQPCEQTAVWFSDKRWKHHPNQPHNADAIVSRSNTPSPNNKKV